MEVVIPIPPKQQDAITLKFIENARNVHGNRYDYSLSDYANDSSPVIIICPKHGQFLQKPKSHLRKAGCMDCFISRNSKTQEQFIADVIKVHGNEYDYSKTVYKTTADKITIICKIHNEFTQRAGSHLEGSKCKKCKTESQTKSQEQFVMDAQKIHGDKYDYSKTIYTADANQITIICRTHGEFYLKANKHLSARQGCASCAIERRRKKQDQFIIDAQKIHGDKYDYSKAIYTIASDKIMIGCKIHGEFYQLASNHIRGVNCPKCTHKTESIVLQYLQQQNITCDAQFAPDWLVNPKTGKRRKFDFAIHNLHLIIELDGAQHFKQTSNWRHHTIQQESDIDKMFLALEHGYSVIRILQEDVFNNTWDWKGFILSNLELLKNQTDDQQIVYQPNTNKYDAHELLFLETAFKRYTAI